ncbi:MAG: SCP2 sterol-binding domain-containing protein [Woeseiaceae bacterium]|nr:SCP2 sterol-binding domain-containing protein [Woeseiaceae bacterium]
MSNSESTGRSPELPTIARKPLAWVPLPVKAKAITSAMNAMFAMPLQEGELDFLAGRVMNVFVSDAELRFSVRLDEGRLRAGTEVAEADLTIEGTVYTFLLLATRKEDADTLFFRRQLKTSGDTELGLYVKNFLDGLEPETLPYHRTVDRILRRSLAVADGVDKIRSRLGRKNF